MLKNPAEYLPQKPEFSTPKRELGELADGIECEKLFTKIVNELFDVDEEFFKKKQKEGISFEELRAEIENLKTELLFKCKVDYEKEFELVAKGASILEARLFRRIDELPEKEEEDPIDYKRYFLYLLKQFFSGEEFKSFENWKKHY